MTKTEDPVIERTKIMFLTIIYIPCFIKNVRANFSSKLKKIWEIVNGYPKGIGLRNIFTNFHGK